MELNLFHRVEIGNPDAYVSRIERLGRHNRLKNEILSKIQMKFSKKIRAQEPSVAHHPWHRVF